MSSGAGEITMKGLSQIVYCPLIYPIYLLITNPRISEESGISSDKKSSSLIFIPARQTRIYFGWTYQTVG